MAEGSKGRLRQLDVLRCVAILMVLFCHTEFTPAIYPAMRKSSILKFIIESTGYGRYGVDLFFVLSGFLVSGLLFREYQKYGKVDIWRFYIRRGFKIYPGYYMMIGTTALLAYVFHLRVFTGFVNAQRVLFASLFIENYTAFTKFHSMMWLPCWSLDVEEHFYILLGLSVAVTLALSRRAKNPFSSLAKAMLVAIPIVIALRSLTFIDGPHVVDTLNSVLYMTHNRMDGMFIGVLLSYQMNFHHDATVEWITSRRKLLIWLSSVSVVLGMICPVTGLSLHLVGYTMMDLGFAGILMLSLTWGKPVLPRWSKLWDGMAHVGAYSYSIYLWHVPVLWYFVYLQKTTFKHILPYTTNTLIFIPLALAFGIAMAKIIEFPCLFVRDKVFPSKSGGL